MHAIRTLVALSVVTLATACASPGYTHATSPSAGTAPMSTDAPESMDAMEPRMKAMQGGMYMMKEMHAMRAGSGKGGMGMMDSPGGGASMAGFMDPVAGQRDGT
jgi:hypothetical protein